MNIAVASDDHTHIAGHFGRTNGFLIYEVKDGQIAKCDYRENTFTGHARGMEGQPHHVDRHGPILSALHDCSVVISRGMGRRIYNDLHQAGKQVFITEEEVAADAVALFLKNGLTDHPEQGCDH